MNARCPTSALHSFSIKKYFFNDKIDLRRFYFRVVGCPPLTKVSQPLDFTIIFCDFKWMGNMV